ncbi:MAG: flavoprotein [Candidatus Hodarchaeales archaeon]
MDLTSFISLHKENLIVWCLTGGGDFFDENYKVFTKLLSEGQPMLAIFSNAGAIVHNRYGFFWNLARLSSSNPHILFLFEGEECLQNNIQFLLDKANISYNVFPYDPAFSLGIWLANQKIRCIVASPLTANSVAKLTHGIADTLIVNILSAGKKANQLIGVFPNQLIGVFPTDRGLDKIITCLPVRQKKPLPRSVINVKDCTFGALKIASSALVKYSPEICVGCQICVKKYPGYFTVNEKIEVRIRKVDQANSLKLADEFRLFQSPDEIFSFVSIS